MNKENSVKNIAIALVIIVGISVAYFLAINVWSNWGKKPVVAVGIEGPRLGWKTFDKLKSQYTNFVFQYPHDWNVQEYRHPLMLADGGLTPEKDSPLQFVILTPPDVVKKEKWSEYDKDQIVVYGGGMNESCAYFRKKNPQTKCEVVGDLVPGSDPGVDYLMTQSTRSDILNVFDLMVKSIPEKHYSL